MAVKKEKEKVVFDELDESAKKRLLAKAMSQLDEFSTEAVMLDKAQSNIDCYDETGCYILNALLSGNLRGGFPEGRLSVLGAESSVGKSYIALQAAAFAQKKGKKVVIFDSENAIDEKFAANLGLDTSQVKYFPVQSIEQCKNAVYKFLKFIGDNGLKGKFFLIIDSLAAMISEMDYKRLDADNNASDMGTRAKAMKQLITVCMNLSGLTKTTIIMTNHVYDDPNAMFPTLEKPMPGGKAIKYYASTLLQLSKVAIKAGDTKRNIVDEAVGGSVNNTGIAIRGVSIKNRIIRPHCEATMYLSWTRGLSKYYGLFDLAKSFDLFTGGSSGKYRDAETDEYLGTAKELIENGDFWEKFMPKLQAAISKSWEYSSQEIDEIDTALDLESEFD